MRESLGVKCFSIVTGSYKSGSNVGGNTFVYHLRRAISCTTRLSEKGIFIVLVSLPGGGGGGVGFMGEEVGVNNISH